MKRVLLISGLVVAALAGWWAIHSVQSVARQIQAQSLLDEARAADIIIVLGAAEYRGTPSPVLTARLNHALFLYLQGLAPRILTTGGAGGDPTFTEGGVAHNYLSRHGVPSEAILVESEGESTVHSIVAAAEIMRRMGLKSCIVVSDGYHIFRVKKLLESRGMIAYGSPRPEERKPDAGGWLGGWVYVRQAIAYGLWRVGIPV
ncbi:MAG: YdcF family protein [Acidobacteriota bacterium]